MSISIHGIEDIQQGVLRLSNQTEKLLDGVGDTVGQVNQVLGNVSDVIGSVNVTLIEMTGLLKSVTNSSEILLIRVDWALKWSIIVLVPLLALVFIALSICLILYGVAKLRKTKKKDSNCSSRAVSMDFAKMNFEPLDPLLDKNIHHDTNGNSGHDKFNQLLRDSET